MTRAGRVLTRHTARQVRLGALLVALAAAGMSALVAGQYQTTFAGALDDTALRALADNPAIRILFGPPVALDDPGGFTVWRTGTPVQVLVGVWALLAATRLTRGEEDAGRADLLLAGRLRRTDLVTRSLAVLAAAAVLIGAAVALALLATGTQPAGALLHGSGILATAVTFAACGVLAAQLLPTRTSATGLTVAALGGGLALRMLADAAGPQHWLGWLTPFGLTARVAPYADNRLAPLLVLAAVPIPLAVAAIIAARHRDLGRGILNPSGRHRPRTRLLGSLTGFATRRALRPTAAWAVGIAAFFLIVGALTATILRFLHDNPRFADLAAAAGVDHLDTADGFAAAMFGLVAIPAGLYAATRIATTAADETNRHWTPLLALPLSRHALVITELAVTTGGVLVLLTTAGLALWATAPLGAADALAGAWNAAPVALLSVGAAVLALGWAPRTVAAVGALPVAGGFLLHTISHNLDAPAWLAGLSPFAHLAAVPDIPPDWPATAGLLTAGALLTALGVVGYARRDLTT